MWRRAANNNWLTTVGVSMASVHDSTRRLFATATGAASSSVSAHEIRTRFLQFFERHHHPIVPSGSLIPPGDDGSLLFTNAGMVPFKQVFLGNEMRNYTRATSAQRCVRAGGKHNDLDQVGITRRHHTLFEMLGNFSFGDYTKDQAIQLAWTFLTKELQLPVQKLHVTVHEQDLEARRLWRAIAQLDDAKIIGFDDKENFWSMGASGPCGPCSEIFWDLGEHIEDPDERYLELWNLVFMQYSREDTPNATLEPLPKPCVDTGMGLERIASVLQGVPSNYHTDLFAPIMRKAAAVMDSKREKTQATSRSFTEALDVEFDANNPVFGDNQQIRTLRIVADHLRASYAMLEDGIFPSNISRGYVLRRIIRRAIRMAHNCGVRGEFLTEIVVPEWEQRKNFVQMRAIISNEERAFQEMLLNGRKALDRAFSSPDKVVSGDQAFLLYDSYGIPLDLTESLAHERGLTVDSAGFEMCMNSHREKAVKENAFSGGSSAASSAQDSVVQDSSKEGERVKTLFTGYETLSAADVNVSNVSESRKPDSVWISISPCPFYPESGGQVGDKGVLRVTGASFDAIVVNDTQKSSNDVIALHCTLPKSVTVGELKQLLENGQVQAHVDQEFRRGCELHHSATHLLQAALKRVLGTHVAQCGSFVTSDRLRFDFSHFGGLTTDETREVETLINTWALENTEIATEELSREEAESTGAICNFGEKYGDVVRVVSIGDSSKEFCGGTHARNSLELFPFVLLSEGSVAAGTRRIEAVCGTEGSRFLQQQNDKLCALAAQLDTTPAKVFERVKRLQKQIKENESVLQTMSDLLTQLPASAAKTGILGETPVEFHAMEVGKFTSMDRLKGSFFSRLLRRRSEFLLAQSPDRVHLVAFGPNVACISDRKDVHAGKLLQQLCKKHNGRGGGSAKFAQGSLGTGLTTQELAANVLLTQ